MTKHRSTIGRRYDWRRDIPDHRDHVFEVKRRLSLPTKVDLSAKCSPVEDQGNLGTCTAHALVGALEFLEDVDGVSFKDLSRRFVYYGERKIEGTIDQDAGAEIRDGVKMLHQVGVCSEDLCPYDISQFAAEPSHSAFLDAAKRKISSYQRINGLAAMRACLAAGFPFAFGFTVFSMFEGDAVARTGKLNLPKSGEKNLGGHAVLAVGYNDASKRVLVRNSWGISWGIRGYFTIPYDYIDNPDLADDFWTIRRGSEL